VLYHLPRYNKPGMQDTRDWKLSERRKSLKSDDGWQKGFTNCLYRPFDIRPYFHHQDAVELPRHEVMKHMIAGDNLALATTRQVTTTVFCHFLCTKFPIEMKTCSHDRATNIFAIYLYDDDLRGLTRRPNLSPKFIEDCAAKLSMLFIQDGTGDRERTFGPEDIFNYMYAVFHSPTYRSRYAEFLKMDFPRLPLTSKPALFRELCTLGQQLVDLHLMETKAPKMTGFPVAGDSTVEKVRYQEPHDDIKGRIWINPTQYFEGIPKEVWEFHIGGYQVCDKWLKDRKGRQLTYDDLTHYQQVVSALAETMKLMESIDAVIDGSGGWPVV